MCASYSMHAVSTAPFRPSMTMSRGSDGPELRTGASPGLGRGAPRGTMSICITWDRDWISRMVEPPAPTTNPTWDPTMGMRSTTKFMSALAAATAPGVPLMRTVQVSLSITTRSMPSMPSRRAMFAPPLPMTRPRASRGTLNSARRPWRTSSSTDAISETSRSFKRRCSCRAISCCRRNSSSARPARRVSMSEADTTNCALPCRSTTHSTDSTPAFSRTTSAKLRPLSDMLQSNISRGMSTDALRCPRCALPPPRGAELAATAFPRPLPPALLLSFPPRDGDGAPALGTFSAGAVCFLPDLRPRRGPGEPESAMAREGVVTRRFTQIRCSALKAQCKQALAEQTQSRKEAPRRQAVTFDVAGRLEWQR